MKVRISSVFGIFLVGLILSISVAGQRTFSNTTAIPIADSDGNSSGIGNPYPSVINVAGMSGTVTDVNVVINSFSHTFPDDLGLLLVSPSGQYMVIQSDSGGGAAALNVTYTLDDQAASGIPNAGPLVAGTFRPSSVGNDDQFPSSGTTPPPNECFPSGSCPQAAPAGTATLNGTFGGISPNGQWKLYAIDCCAADSGTINGGWSVTITTTAPISSPNDISGDGKTDFLVVRGDGPVSLTEFMGVNDSTGKSRKGIAKLAALYSPSVTGMGWWTATNNGTLLPTNLIRRDLGTLTDTFVTADFDGDLKKDLAVWSPGAPPAAGFRILKSSTNTVQFIPFGQTGDDPTVVGDWNGDGVADVAVYRDNGNPALQNYFFWASLATSSTINYVPWGAGGDYGFALDYDGDAKLDAAVQRDPGSGVAEFWIRNTGNGAITLVPAYGLSSDFIVPGDFDGDGRDDIAVSRNADFGAGLRKYFFVLQSNGGGSPFVPVQWGIPGDMICQGDYDGDGKTDIAIWRSNPDPTQNYFWVRKSSDGGLIVFEWGQSGDYPVNNWNVH